MILIRNRHLERRDGKAGNAVVICKSTAAYGFMHSFGSGGSNCAFREYAIHLLKSEDLHHGCGTPGAISVGYPHWKSDFEILIKRLVCYKKVFKIANIALKYDRNKLAPRQKALRESSLMSK